MTKVDYIIKVKNKSRRYKKIKLPKKPKMSDQYRVEDSTFQHKRQLGVAGDVSKEGTEETLENKVKEDKKNLQPPLYYSNKKTNYFGVPEDYSQKEAEEYQNQFVINLSQSPSEEIYGIAQGLYLALQSSQQIGENQKDALKAAMKALDLKFGMIGAGNYTPTADAHKKMVITFQILKYLEQKFLIEIR